MEKSKKYYIMRKNSVNYEELFTVLKFYLIFFSCFAARSIYRFYPIRVINGHFLLCFCFILLISSSILITCGIEYLHNWYYCIDPLTIPFDETKFLLEDFVSISDENLQAQKEENFRLNQKKEVDAKKSACKWAITALIIWCTVFYLGSNI